MLPDCNITVRMLFYMYIYNQKFLSESGLSKVTITAKLKLMTLLKFSNQQKLTVNKNLLLLYLILSCDGVMV